ncbi:ABC transporter permease [Yinghuangia aomiensis]|uniref:Xylose transport system permease protein XylH n=1 Tax=Yinghuangia aomiensis TaxID=676205 RepID=A0ABP9HQQ7_9ACTN
MTTGALPRDAADPPAASPPPSPTADYLRGYLAKLRGGDMGVLPALLGLVILVTVFSVMRPRFLSAGNFANLFTQGAAVTVIAMGLTFVLVLGEIDLSAGFASGVCAAVAAVLMDSHGAPWYLATAAALLTGAVIGMAIGVLVAKLGIPSFVVTLGGFLAFQGVLLMIVENGKNVPVRDKTILAVANNSMPPWLGIVLAALAVGAWGAAQFARDLGRTRRGLAAPPRTVTAMRVGALAVAAGVGVYALNLERSHNAAQVSLRGVPIVVPVIVVLLAAGTFLLRRTAFGLSLYAVGGNREAARRAGIDVDRVRISAFVICSTLAAIGGIIAASRANSVDPNTGGSNVLLYAVGAAVIGGTSLFGGKGRVLDAVVGGAVVAVIDNGMGLMGYSAGVKYVVTGSVLLLAAGVDALSRKRAEAVGLR